MRKNLEWAVAAGYQPSVREALPYWRSRDRGTIQKTPAIARRGFEGIAVLLEGRSLTDHAVFG